MAGDKEYDTEDDLEAPQDEDNGPRIGGLDEGAELADSGTGDVSELESLRQEVEVLGQKASENLELAQRARAELDNMRKRTVRDIENAHKFALEKFVSELLPVLDSLELGIQASATAGESEVAGLREGMDLTLKKFSDTLEKFGVVVVDPQGDKFNPEKHNAVSMTKLQDTDPGKVISVLQKGYELNGRLLRPAMVVVSS